MDPNKKKKSGQRSHSESRECVCGVCFLKGPVMRLITSETESLIQSFVSPQFSLTNPALPISLCNKCRMKLYVLEKVRFSYNKIIFISCLLFTES